MKEILIIEDDAVMQHLLRNLFTDAGFKVKSIMDGKDIKRETLSDSDLIIVDMMIPHIYESADLINLYSGQHSPIIVISSIDVDDGLYFKRKINAEAFFSKPINPSELLKEVKFHLNHHENEQLAAS